MFITLLTNRRSTLALRKLYNTNFGLKSKVELYLLDTYFRLTDKKPKGFSKEAKNALVLLKKRNALVLLKKRNALFLLKKK